MNSTTLPTLLLVASMPVTQIFARDRLYLADEAGLGMAGGSVPSTWISQRSTPTANQPKRWVAVVQRSERFPDAILRIREYEGLPEGWDGDCGRPASEEAAGAARAFLAALPDGMPEPSTMISPDGEVGLYWTQDGYYAEAGFQSGGQSYFFSKGSGRTPMHLDDYAPSEPSIHQELASALLEPLLLAA